MPLFSMAGLRNIKLSAAAVDKVALRAEAVCTEKAKRLLSRCMIVSAAFLAVWADHFSDEGAAEEAFEKLLVALGIPIDPSDAGLTY